MRRRLIVSTALAVMTGSALLAQSPSPRPAAGGIPRTSEGRPDLQGMWTNATITTLERPAGLEGKAYLSEAEAEAHARTFLEANSIDRRPTDRQQDVNLAYQNFYLDRGTELTLVDGQRRTSLIVDPVDGKLPPMSPDGQKRSAGRRGPARPTSDAGENSGGSGVGAYDDIEQRPLAERCLLAFGSSSGPPMHPVLYNNHYQIVQTKENVSILVEMVHDARIIRVNGTHLPAHLRRWMGDSIGRWDGDTFVVETTNFTDKTQYRGSTENLKVTERFTMTDANTILYRFTVEDPHTWTRPWTAELSFRRTDDIMYEYACHEGNYAFQGIMKGARLLEAEAAGKLK